MAFTVFHVSPLPARRHAVPAAVLTLLATTAPHTLAQDATADTTTTGAPARTETPSANLPAVTITGRTLPVAGVAGWGDTPLADAPLQGSVVTNTQLRERGITRLSEALKSDASVGDAYNAEGYWDMVSVRGFTLDNRFNYRRNGLPISAETSIPLDNKERVEILKGASGIQAGTSAPGGLVNLVTKRPTATPLRDVQLAWQERGSVLGALDLSQRFGTDQAFGLRLNAAYEHLDPPLRNARGERHLLALAGDWRPNADTHVDVEFETSRRAQPSQAGFSLLGNTVPSPVDPRLNLNNQPWSQPVVMDAQTASLRVEQALSGAWRGTLHAATQRLTTDDRMAFAYGCDAEGHYDRFCSDGSFDVYDFRSDNERRRTDALELALNGEFSTGRLRHAVSGGVLLTRLQYRFNRQAYNYVGTGWIDGSAVTPADPSLTDENTQRDERSTEWFVRDQLHLSERWTAWLGLRHTQLQRSSVRTDGSRATHYEQHFTTPSLALSYTLAPEQIVYASWGRGVESDVVPNRPRYGNAGQALSSTSRQSELGLKVSNGAWQWGGALFEITRAQWSNVGGTRCDSDSAPTAGCWRVEDGVARHRGLEAYAAWQHGPWALHGSLQWLKARRESALDPSLDGQRPVNVPERSMTLQARYQVAAVPGLQWQTDVSAVSNRTVLPNDSQTRIPGYALVDLGARYEHQHAGTTYTWRAGVDNVFDRRVWREAPFQFDHVYLYPAAPKTFRISLDIKL